MEKALIKIMRTAIKKNDIVTIKDIINNNEGSLEIVTVFGTFLHDAASFGRFDIVKYLVEKGMDVNKKAGVNDGSALTEAAFKGHIDIVKYLYDNGTVLDVTSMARNPLFAAIYNGHFEVVKFLVDKGINLDVQYAVGDFDTIDAYEYARQYGRTEIANYLKEKMGK